MDSVSNHQDRQKQVGSTSERVAGGLSTRIKDAGIAVSRSQESILFFLLKLRALMRVPSAVGLLLQ